MGQNKSFIKKAGEIIKIRGVGGFLKYCIQYYLGIIQLQNETSALYHFLDEIVDIRDYPRTKNKELRILQDCDTLLLGIFDKLCRKHGLTYWIDYGTLLGAIRHGGFIPWDDDTDLSMPRVDFEKAHGLLHDELNKYGISLDYYVSELHCLTLSYRHEETGIWADIFPMDTFVSPYDLEKTRVYIAKLLSKYLKYYDAHISASKELIWKKKEELVFRHQSGNNKYVFSGQEFRPVELKCFLEEDIYPCRRVGFNGVELNAPANSEAYLTCVYGKNYMSFPHGGVLHHGISSGRPPLDQWAKLHNVDMSEVKSYLEKVFDEI